MNFLLYFAVKYVEQLEDMSNSLKYCLGYILKVQKVLNERIKREKFVLWELAIFSSLSLYSILVRHECNDHAWLTSECSSRYYDLI